MNVLCLIEIHRPSKFGYYSVTVEKQYKKHGGGYKWAKKQIR